MDKTEKAIINYSVEKKTKDFIESLALATRRNQGSIVDMAMEQFQKSLSDGDARAVADGLARCEPIVTL